MRKLNNLIGNTPLIKISDNLYGKLETYNPAGSVKDRMISYVVQKAQLYGQIKPGTIMCDATSGNTGIALSMAASCPSWINVRYIYAKKYVRREKTDDENIRR